MGRIRLRQGFRRDKGSRAERPERKNRNRKASIRVLRFLVVQNPRRCQSGIAAAPCLRRPRFGLGWLPPGRGHAPQSQRTPPHGRGHGPHRPGGADQPVATFHDQAYASAACRRRGVPATACGQSSTRPEKSNVAIMLIRLLANQGRAALPRHLDIGAAQQRGPAGMEFCQPTG